MDGAAIRRDPGLLLALILLLIAAPAAAQDEGKAAPDPAAVVGAWADVSLLAELTPEDLELRAGCTVYLTFDGAGRFFGGTEGHGCASGLRGAAYATSEVVVSPGRIESWDRGFDEGGNQVWGAEKGAYLFLRSASYDD